MIIHYNRNIHYHIVHHLHLHHPHQEEVVLVDRVVIIPKERDLRRLALVEAVNQAKMLQETVCRQIMRHGILHQMKRKEG